MSKIQEIFNRTQDTKKEMKEIKLMYKDALSNSGKYLDIVEEIKALKEKKKQIEDGVKSDFSSELDKLEILKNDFANDNQLLTDVAINQVIKGEKIEVQDRYETKHHPVFSVKFKKD